MKRAKELTGGLGYPSKMPGTSYGVSARNCKTGAKLAKVPGTICSLCYANGANYRYPSVEAAHANREAAMVGLTDQWIDAMAFSICAGAVKTGVPFHRWFDSGDLQSVDQLRAIAKVARRTPKIKHWLPTKEYAMVREYMASDTPPANLTIRVSGYKIDGGAPSWPATLGLTVSSVHRVKPIAGARACKAIDDKCGDCRDCWKPSVKHISYKLH
jgi:hypothetical protein